jgi:hypothetical protein
MRALRRDLQQGGEDFPALDEMGETKEPASDYDVDSKNEQDP